jgi:hypothetical protein
MEGITAAGSLDGRPRRLREMGEEPDDEGRTQPGAPESGEFRKRIERLADVAEREVRERRGAPRLRRRSRLRQILWGGGVLITAEALLLVVQLVRVRPPAVRTAARSGAEIFGGSDCRAAIYDAYRGVLSYVRDNQHPPDSLADLIGKYTERLPVDPETGQSLSYSRNGKHFSLRCPGRSPAGP